MSRQPEKEIANEIRMMREQSKYLISAVNGMHKTLEAMGEDIKIFVNFLIRNVPKGKE